MRVRAAVGCSVENRTGALRIHMSRILVRAYEEGGEFNKQRHEDLTDRFQPVELQGRHGPLPEMTGACRGLLD